MVRINRCNGRWMLGSQIDRRWSESGGNAGGKMMQRVGLVSGVCKTGFT
jgi:hypothetical protein